MSEQFINSKVVPTWELSSIFVLGEAVEVAEGCSDCEVLDTRRVEEDMFIIGGYEQGSLLTLLNEDQQRHPPDMPRREKEIVVDEAKRRAQDGINGTACKFICSVPDCWRRNETDESESESKKYLEGRDLALKADFARDDALRLGRLARIHRTAAERIAGLSVDSFPSPYNTRNFANQRASLHQNYGNEAQIKADDAIDRFNALKDAAGTLLGLPDVPEGFSGQEDTFTVE